MAKGRKAVDLRVIASELVARARHLGNPLHPEQLNPDSILQVRRAAPSPCAAQAQHHDLIVPESKARVQTIKSWFNCKCPISFAEV